jgi:hypothetical protein
VLLRRIPSKERTAVRLVHFKRDEWETLGKEQ